MKISLKWLNNYVDVSDYFPKVQELADLLTRAGLEVEEISDKAKDLQNVVVGHVKVKDKHPNADKLSLCQVETAPGKIEQIVCGAQNHKTGDKVVVALPGAVLPGNFAIKKSKIRDVESNGMLCSFKEVGQATESDGIIILDPAAQVGTPYAQYAGLDDVTFELKVTPNRADCLSHYGLAREIGCLLNRPVKPVEVQKSFSSQSTKSKIGLDVQNASACIRYSGRYVSGVKISESPAWLKQKLESIGVNSINNVVDVTNYVMHELGQPLHAFDADLLSGSKIIVRTANKGEKFKTLKEQEITLSGEELMICDGEKPVALAGVIGGLNSGVSDKTKNIFIESANFDSMATRKSSRSHGIETDSAYRFSRGVDPSGTLTAMDRAALLIQQVAGGEAFGDNYDIYPKPITKAPVLINIKTVSDRLGYTADEKLFVQYLNGLHCKVESKGNGDYSVVPPLFRFDLERDMDLVEEYARLNGYEKLGETLPEFKKQPTQHDPKYIFNNHLSKLLQAKGLSQAFNYAFTSEVKETEFIQKTAGLTAVGLLTDEKPVFVKNPLSEDLNGMRRMLSYPLWKNVIENYHMGNSAGSLYEIGSVFSKTEAGYGEVSRLAFVSWGEEFGLYSNKTPQVYKVRSVIESIFSWLNINTYSFKAIPNGLPFLHHGQCAAVFVEGKNIGFIGTVHPLLTAKEKIRTDVAIAEINLEALLKISERPSKFKSLPAYQAIERDFAFVMDSQKSMGDLTAEIKKSGGSTVGSVTIFDIYEGDKLPQGQKSVALRVAFQPAEANVNEATIQDWMNKVVSAAEKSVGAKLRS